MDFGTNEMLLATALMQTERHSVEVEGDDVRLVEEVNAEISCRPAARVAALLKQHMSWSEAHILAAHLERNGRQKNRIVAGTSGDTRQFVGLLLT
jgi:hypothetical protein